MKPRTHPNKNNPDLPVEERPCSMPACDNVRGQTRHRYCRSCHAANMRERRKSEPSGYSHLPEPQRSKVKARKLLSVALRRGNVVRAPCCQFCLGDEKLNGHHEDYSQPLVVVWLCAECHRLVHAWKLSSSQ